MAQRSRDKTSLLPRHNLSTESLPASPAPYGVHFQDIPFPRFQPSSDYVPITTSHRTVTTSSAQHSRTPSQNVRFAAEPRSRFSDDSDIISTTAVYSKRLRKVQRGPRSPRIAKDSKPLKIERDSKPPSRIHQAMSSLFSGRKENAGILDRNAVAAKPTKTSFSMLRVMKGAKEENNGLPPEIENGKPSLAHASSFFSIRNQTSSVPTRKTVKNGYTTRPIKHGDTTIPVISTPYRLGSHRRRQDSTDDHAERRRQVRRSRSFSGFRDSGWPYDRMKYAHLHREE